MKTKTIVILGLIAGGLGLAYYFYSKKGSSLEQSEIGKTAETMSNGNDAFPYTPGPKMIPGVGQASYYYPTVDSKTSAPVLLLYDANKNFLAQVPNK